MLSFTASFCCRGTAILLKVVWRVSCRFSGLGPDKAGNTVPALCRVIHPVNQHRIHFTAGESWLQKYKACKSESTVSTYCTPSVRATGGRLSSAPVAASRADDEQREQQRRRLPCHMTATCCDTGLAGVAVALLSRYCVLRLSAHYLCICSDSAVT